MISSGQAGSSSIPTQALKAFEDELGELDIPGLTAHVIADCSLGMLKTHAWMAADEFITTEFDPWMILEKLDISNSASFVRLVNNAAMQFAEYAAEQAAACARYMCEVRFAFRRLVIDSVRKALNGQTALGEGLEDGSEGTVSQSLDRLLFELDFLEPEQLALHDKRLPASDNGVVSAAVESIKCAEDQNRQLMQDIAAARLSVVTSPDYVSRVELEYFDISYEDAFYSLEPLMRPMAIHAIKGIELNARSTE